jgi:hypothetical protein
MPSAMSFVGLEAASTTSNWKSAKRRSTARCYDEGLKRLSEAGYTAKGELVAGEAYRRDRALRPQDGSRPDRGRPQAPGQLGRRRWRGSISGALIEHAPCSVLVVITP